MKKALFVLVALVVASPCYAALWNESKDAEKVSQEQVSSVPAAKAVTPPAPTAPVVVSKDELMQRSLKGVENQKAWISTLEKQLAGEKAKLAQMEAEHAKMYGGSTKKS